MKEAARDKLRAPLRNPGQGRRGLTSGESEGERLIPVDEQFGRYRLIRRIAVGGMGEVFLARYLNAAGIERYAVVKRILPHLTHDPDFVSYFVNEGRITSLLSHPNVVHTLELGRTANQYYIAMEYIPGRTLVRLLATALTRGRPFSIPLIMHAALQMVSALEYIHSVSSLEQQPLNIIHMDLAPHNVLVSPEGSVKLLDFGISRSGLTHEALRRDFRGRTAYMAPECLDGLPLDHRVDLFAMGVMMHEMVLCRPLFRAHADHQTATRVLYASIPRLRGERRDCPELLERIILRALSRDRDERFETASQMFAELDACVRANNIVCSLTEIRGELAELAAHEEDAQEPVLEPGSQTVNFEFRASGGTSVE
jgi:eukaryotic-like serine/threonine-protein kinase